MGLVESSAADAVFACSSRKVIPGKHLSLAFVVKSMTGSKGSDISISLTIAHRLMSSTISKTLA